LLIPSETIQLKFHRWGNWIKGQTDNRLIVIPHKKILVHSLKDGSYDTLAVLNQNVPEEKYICFIEKVNDNKFNENGESTVRAVNKITKPPNNSPDLPPTSSNYPPANNLSPTEYIHLAEFVNNLDEEFASDLVSMLENNLEVLATSSEELSPSLLIPHHIDLKLDATPIMQRAYCLSKAKSDILKSEIGKLIEKNLITPSNSPWSSPVVLVPKHNGKWRLCVDYRKFNQVTIVKM